MSNNNFKTTPKGSNLGSHVSQLFENRLEEFDEI